MLFAVSVEEAELFKGVPGISAEPEAPGIPGTAPAAPGEAGTSELRQEVSSSARGVANHARPRAGKLATAGAATCCPRRAAGHRTRPPGRAETNPGSGRMS